MKLDIDFFSTSRVRLVRQSEVAECGLACLTMAANFHGLDVDLGTMRRRFTQSLRGANLKSMMNVADQIGLTPRALKLPLEALGDLHMPAILHWDASHFVVLERMSGGQALICDPAGTRRWQKLEEVSPHFTGVALELRPNDDFETGTQRERLSLRQLWRRMSGLKRALVQLVILSLMMQVFVLASPYYMQLAIDRALPALDQNLLLVLAIGFGLFTLFNAAASFLRSFVLLAAGSAVGYGVASNIARRLFRLPISWFEKRSTGDVLSRFQSIRPIQLVLTQGTVAALLDGALAIFTLALMVLYSPLLAVIAVFAFTLYAIVRVVSFSLEREAQEASIVAAGKEQTTMIETLRGITTLRMFGTEMLRHALWQGRLTDAVNAEIRLKRVGIWQATANLLIFGIETIVTIWLAIGFVIEGDGFSVGMVFAYLAYKGQFTEKGGLLIDQIIAFRMLGLHLERLSDIALTDEDPVFEDPSDQLNDELIEGAITLKDVYFRYGPDDPYVLEGLSLQIEAGEHVAITGPSGGGKSTLAKVILGLIEPDSGEVLVDGRPRKQVGLRNFRSQCAAVLQDDSLFAGTIADNIALFDDYVDMNRVIQSAKMASIHTDIANMPMRYDTLVGDMGSALSGGQKQRILIARALYRQPRVLLMDEGTSHLDTGHEHAVNEAVRSLGITRIIIAHRKETIEAADRVLVLVNGSFQTSE